MSASVRVVKLGGSVLRSDEGVAALVDLLRREVPASSRVVAVVSAFEGVTDRLWRRAKSFGGRPDPGRLAAFVACGEEEATAAIALAASAAGAEAVRLAGVELGLVTCGPALAAAPVRLRGRRLERALERAPLVVVPGYVGRDEEGRTTLLGRGGSDSTAVFLAAALGGTCRLVKDVDGWYASDPATDATARRYRSIHWDHAIEHPAPIVQPEAVRLARSLGQRFEVTGVGDAPGTCVGPEPTELAAGCEAVA